MTSEPLVLPCRAYPIANPCRRQATQNNFILSSLGLLPPSSSSLLSPRPSFAYLPRRSSSSSVLNLLLSVFSCLPKRLAPPCGTTTPEMADRAGCWPKLPTAPAAYRKLPTRPAGRTGSVPDWLHTGSCPPNLPTNAQQPPNPDACLTGCPPNRPHRPLAGSCPPNLPTAGAVAYRNSCLPKAACPTPAPPNAQQPSNPEAYRAGCPHNLPPNSPTS